MKLALVPTDPIEEVMLAGGKFPVPMMLAWMGAAASRLLVVGVRLGVFDRLAAWPGGPYDLVLLSHFLHCLPGPRAAEAVRRAAAVLAPGGRVAVHDVFIAEPDGELAADDVTFSLVYFTGTGGRCWPVSTYCRWLADAGLVDVAGRRLESGAVLITGAKP